MSEASAKRSSKRAQGRVVTGATLIHAAIIAAVVLVCYLRTWDFNFTYVDDDRLILQRQAALTEPGAWGHAFTRPYFEQGALDHSYYRPLVTASYVLDARLDGEHARGYHFTNVVLHAGVAVLVLLWLRTRARNSAVALFGALLFALHPALAEAVGWVPGRPDVLMTGFSITAWILFRRDLEKPTPWCRVAHHGAWLLALLCKEAALVLPLVWLLERRLLHRKSWRQLAQPWWLVGWALVLGIYLVLRANALRAAPGVFGIGIGAHVASAMVENASVLVSSLGKLVLPIQLSVLAISTDTWLWPGLVVLFAGAVLWQRKVVTRESLVFAAVAYVLVMLPNLSVSSKLALESRLYLPLLPVLELTTLAIEAANIAMPRLMLMGGATLALFAGGTLSYIDVFRDRRSFALAAVRGSPHSALAHKNLGLVTHAAGKIDKAEREYRAALELDPSEPMAHNNLGSILGARRQFAAAESEFRAELSVNPTYAPAHHNLAALLQATHRADEAVIHWQASLEGNCQDTAAMHALYTYYAARHDPRAAQYQRLIEPRVNSGSR
jgi:hypothetical protein